MVAAETKPRSPVVKYAPGIRQIDLEFVDSVLNGVRAYPLICRGGLCGILVCGRKRDGQGYAPDEAEARVSVAQGVGSALGMLRACHDDLDKNKTV